MENKKINGISGEQEKKINGLINGNYMENKKNNGN